MAHQLRPNTRLGNAQDPAGRRYQFRRSGCSTSTTRCAKALPSGRRLALLGLKYPERWPGWLIRLGILLQRPFEVSQAYAALRPWESVRQHMREVEHREYYAGAAYLLVGTVERGNE